MTHLVWLSVVVPLATAALGIAVWGRRTAQLVVALAGSLSLPVIGAGLVASAARYDVLVVEVGGWPAPFGITLAADRLSAVMVLLSGLVGLAVTVYAAAEIDPKRRSFAFLPLVHVLLAGVNGSFVTADLFNLYVWFEVMLIGSFGLLTLGAGRPAIEGTLKYVVLNLVGSTLFLAATGAMYAVARTLNLAELSVRMPEIARESPELVTGLAGLYLVAFGIKAGVFPLFFWLPASYHTPAFGVSALFAGLLTKVGVYALVRVFTTAFADVTIVFVIVLVVAGITMAIGVLGAVAQYETRRILGFHIVSQIGYIVVGLGLLASDSAAVRRAGLTAAIFYTAHHIVVKANLYLVSGVVKARSGDEHLSRLGGLAKSAPWLAVLFVIPAASLAGIPPLSGFWAKLAVIRATVDAQTWAVLSAALGAGFLTVVSMTKIWTEAFWKPVPEPVAGVEPRGRSGTAEWASLGSVRRFALVAPIVAMAAITVWIGLLPGALYDYADRAAGQLVDPSTYVERVRGGGTMP